MTAGNSGRRAQRDRIASARAAAFLAAALWAAPAAAQSADCVNLRSLIAGASHGGSSQGEQYQAAASKQRSEIDRTVAYAQSLGCDRRQFLIFGSPPPPQCGAINAQIGKMQGNLQQLQARAGGGDDGRRAELIARYNAECTSAAPARSNGFFDTLFGGQREDPQNGLTDAPLSPDANPDDQTGDGKEARAGSKAVCVKTCDGSFFPVSYSAGGRGLSDLESMCHALCPNAEVSLYTYPGSGDIEHAVSISGERYVDMPNALKYRTSVDPTCSCRKHGQSWAQTLANAEQQLGDEHKTDIIVTPEKAIELSRAQADPKAKPKVAPGPTVIVDSKAAAPPPPKVAPDPTKASATDMTPTEKVIDQQQQSISRESSGIGAGDVSSGPSVGEDQGQTREIVGPDGVKRRVRIIDPTL